MQLDRADDGVKISVNAITVQIPALEVLPCVRADQADLLIMESVVQSTTITADQSTAIVAEVRAAIGSDVHIEYIAFLGQAQVLERTTKTTKIMVSTLKGRCSGLVTEWKH